MKMGHRRVHSEIFFRFPNEISFGGSMDGGDEVDDLLATYMDMENIEYFGENKSQPMNINHALHNHNHNHNHNKKHRHFFSVDEFSKLNNENDYGYLKSNKDTRIASLEAKKAMTPDKLAELWNVDPKRAKRILANRQSAARSKERKARYTQELEKKAQSLQTEATALSVQHSLFKRDTSGLTSENIELRRQLESMEQQAQLRDALNDALKQELDRLKAATGDTSIPADAFVMPVQHISCPPPKQQSPFFEPNILNVSCVPPALDSVQTDFPVFCPPGSNMLNSAKEPEFCTDLYDLSESCKSRMPQFCTTEANMNYAPQMMDSPLGHLPTYNFESQSQSPDQEVFNMISQSHKQDHISKFQGLDINGFDSYHVLKVEGPSIIANESTRGF